MLRNNLNNTRILILASLFTALGIVLYIVESLFPVLIPLAGAKLGLANIITLLSLQLFTPLLTLTILILRVFIASLIGGTFLSLSFYLSLSGAMLSFLVMLFAFKSKFFNIFTVSILGAAAHSLGQIFCIYFLLDNINIAYYLPILLLVSIPLGFFTGILANNLHPYLKKFQK
ncbi:MAG: Gx transporter family protein [Clostridia bacterium]